MAFPISPTDGQQVTLNNGITYYYDNANTAWVRVGTTGATAISAYQQANTGVSLATGAFIQANSSFNTANSAYTAANSAVTLDSFLLMGA